MKREIQFFSLLIMAQLQTILGYLAGGVLAVVHMCMTVVLIVVALIIFPSSSRNESITPLVK